MSPAASDLTAQLRPGELRHQITLQRKTNQRSADGGVLETWGNVATVWSQIVPLEGREWAAGGRIAAEVTHAIRIRYRQGIVPKMRATFGARVFDIRAVTSPGELGAEMHLHCVELVR